MKNIKEKIIIMAIMLGTITLPACDEIETVASDSFPKTTKTAATSIVTETKAALENTIPTTEATSAVDSDIEEIENTEVSSGIDNDSITTDDSITTYESIQDYTDIAYSLMGALDYIDSIGACCIPFDDSATYTDDNGNTYEKVAKTQFSNTADLREYMESYLTESFINDRYSGILGTESPKYIDVDGVLYGKYAPKGGGFPWTDTPLKIENVSDTSINILAEYDNYGAAETMSIEAVMDNGSWKINGITL